jgi:hypothetical protein
LFIQFIALGTHWGIIHILDVMGNSIRSKELPAVSYLEVLLAFFHAEYSENDTFLFVKGVGASQRNVSTTACALTAFSDMGRQI